MLCKAENIFSSARSLSLKTQASASRYYGDLSMCVNAQTGFAGWPRIATATKRLPLIEVFAMPSDPLSQVLFVDDDAEAGEMLSLLLKSHGVEVTCAHSAADAWLTIKANCFDLYLLDAWLPELDGFELCRQIRQCDSDTPIVFYSGAAYDADRQKGIAAGANAYVTKPDLDGLIETMTNLIARATADAFAARGISNPRPAESWLSSRFFGVETALD